MHSCKDANHNLIDHTVYYDCMIDEQRRFESLEQNSMIKLKYLFRFFVHLLGSIRKFKLHYWIIIGTSTCISPYSHNNLHD